MGLVASTMAARKFSGSRPIFAWIVASVVLLTVQFHRGQDRQATIQFTVSMEGRTTRPVSRAELNQSAFNAGGHSGLGQKKLTIHATNAEPFITNFFVWYGGKTLGNIALVRSRGTLDCSITPTALRLSVSGQETNATFAATAHQLLSLPTGRYKVSAEFARFTRVQEMEISVNQTQRLSIEPGFTVLRLISEPTNAAFELNSLKPEGISIRSNTPIVLTEMPSGEYELRIWNGDYRKNVPIRVMAAEATNEFTVVFEYAHLTVTSDPADARILNGEKSLGRTPATLDLQPGSYRLAIVKEGFQSTNVSLTLVGNATNTLTVTLHDLAFLQAMERARHELSAFNVSYDRALAEVEEALQIKPADEEARSLKRTIQFNRHLRNAKQFDQERAYSKALAEIDAALKLNADHKEALAFKTGLEKSKREADQAAAEERRAHPEKVFQQVASRLQHHELFQPQLMRFSNSLDTVQAGVLRALGRNPEWSVSPAHKPDGDTAIIHANIKSFGGRKNVVIVAGQTADNEVTLYFKLIELTLDTKLEVSLKGVSEDSYRPLHVQHVSAVRAPFVEKQRAGSIQEFKKRIEEELR